MDYTIVNSGLYSLFAAGAQGGAIPGTYMQQNTGGGLGATVSGANTLYAGDVLEIAVGGRGLTSDYTAGGGGGTFVALLRGGVLTPLIVAGGGGGAGFSDNQSGRSGGAGPDGSGGGDYLPAADGICGGAGGTNGGGGSPGRFCGSSLSWPQYPGGAGGAGFYGNGGNASFDGVVYAGGGQSFAAGLAGGVASSGNGAGGFGGGGAGYGGSGGGGGGYGGGGGGSHRSGQGGGGGSYYDPDVFDVSVVSGAQSGDGVASLTWWPPIVVALPGAAVPEPATWAMMLLGLGGIGAALRRNRNRNGTPVAA